jgi:Domain of unknown function (DUF4926)
MLREHDIIALTRAVPEEGLEAGDIGTIIAVHKGGEGYTLEFMTISGKTVAIATVEAAAVRPIKDQEIASARQVA